MVVEAEGKALSSKRPEAGVDELTAFSTIEKVKGRDVTSDVPQYTLEEGSLLFDRDFYLDLYGDVRDSGFDAFEHYHHFGYAEQRRPCSREALLAFLIERQRAPRTFETKQASCLNGNITIVQEDPAVLELLNHVYCPQTSGSVPGIYDFGRKLIPQSCYSRGPIPSDVVPSVSLPFAYNDVTEFAEDETFIYLGPIHPHFGHFLLSTLSRLWKIRALPSCKIIYYAGGLHPNAMSPHVLALIRAFGVDPSRLISFDRPIKIRRILLPCPSIEEQNFVHAIFGSSYNDAGDRLIENVSSDLKGDGPIYLSKSRITDGVRKILNEEAIEARLAQDGFTIVYPETLTIGQQVALWRCRRPMIAFSGSSLHLSAFTTGARITNLRWDDQVDTTFPLIDACNGHDAKYLHFGPGAFKELGPTPGSNGIGGLSSRLLAIEPIEIAESILRSVL